MKYCIQATETCNACQ